MAMLPALLPAILGAVGTMGSTIIGGLMEQGEARRAESVGFAREDNKVQRLVADAKAAGVSPLAALGSSAAGALASPVMSDAGDLFAQGGGNAFAQVGAISSLMQQEAQTELLKSQSRLIEQEARSRSVASAAREAVRDVPAVTLPLPDYPRVRPSPTSSAQAVQDEYGDVVENVYGIGRLVHDLIMNVAPSVNAVPGHIRRSLPPGGYAAGRGRSYR